MARKLAIVTGVVVAALVVFGLVVRRMVDPEVVRAAVEQQASAALGQPVKVGTVDWALSARPRVVLTNVQIGSPAAITLSRVEVSTGLRALLSKRVERGGLVICSRITLPLPFVLGGTTGAAGTPTSDAAVGLTFASIDRISLSDIDLAVGNTHLKLDMESSLSGDRLAVSRVRLRSDRTSLDGSGEVASLAASKSSFTVTGNPLDLDEYGRNQGFQALRAALERKAPEKIVEEIAASGLRGRGGAGFPTGRKWAAVRAAPGADKVAIMNGDEGDPANHRPEMEEVGMVECLHAPTIHRSDPMGHPRNRYWISAPRVL